MAERERSTLHQRQNSRVRPPSISENIAAPPPRLPVDTSGFKRARPRSRSPPRKRTRKDSVHPPRRRPYGGRTGNAYAQGQSAKKSNDKRVYYYRRWDRSRSRPRSEYSVSSASTYIETEEERRIRWEAQWRKERHKHPPRPTFVPLQSLPRRRAVLKLEYWSRTPDNAERKEVHMEQLDQISRMSREEWILRTTLKDIHVAIEPNLFPYETPSGVSHYTLWSRTYLYTDEVESFVECWLDQYRPSVQAWGWDPSNLSEGMSVDLYHVHVYFWEPLTRMATLQEFGSIKTHRASLPLPNPVDVNYPGKVWGADRGNRHRGRSRSPSPK